MARKNTTRWTRDSEGPVLQVDVEGEDAPTEAARQEFLAPPESEPQGGFGGPEYDVASMPVVEGYDDDPGEDYDAEALAAARERWLSVQGAEGNQAADGGWDEPYAEPDEGQSDEEIKAWTQAPAGETVVEKYGFAPEDVDRMASMLEDQGIDPEVVKPTFLANRFGISREQALALQQQMAEMVTENQ